MTGYERSPDYGDPNPHGGWSLKVWLVIHLAATILVVCAVASQATQLCPKYGVCVPAETFECEEITRSSFITRVCYDHATAYLVIRLKATDYHYCSVDAATIEALMEAGSMGRYYNRHIKSGKSGGPFDCRTHAVPQY